MWSALAAAMLSNYRRMLGLPDPEPAPPDPVHDAMVMAATAEMQMAVFCPDQKLAAEAMGKAIEWQWKMVEHNILKTFEQYNDVAVRWKENRGRLDAELVSLRDPGGDGSGRHPESEPDRAPDEA